MKPKLLIVTGNILKFRELSDKLSDFFDCEQKNIEGYEIQGTPEEILKYKLQQAFEKFQQPVLVDDTSAHFDKLFGLPGPYMKDFCNVYSPFEIGTNLAGSRVKVFCRLGLYDGKGDPIIAEGLIEGEIIKPKTKDHKGREFDLYVQLDGMDKPMIEYSIEEKNEFSHRGKAMKNLLEILKKE